MMRLAIVATLVVLATSACSRGRSPTAPGSTLQGAEPHTIAFVGVNVVPMDRDGIVENQTVVVQRGRISVIGPAATVAAPPGSLRIDGSGKFLMPGIAEMHAHLPTASGPDEGDQLDLFLANGVTLVRSMVGAPNQLELRDRIAHGTVVGPRLVIFSPPMNGGSTPTPERGTEQVAEYARAGYDGIKILEGLTLPTYEGIA